MKTGKFNGVYLIFLVANDMFVPSKNIAKETLCSSFVISYHGYETEKVTELATGNRVVCHGHQTIYPDV